jgi:hypothetical protein
MLNYIETIYEYLNCLWDYVRLVHLSFDLALNDTMSTIEEMFCKQKNIHLCNKSPI